MDASNANSNSASRIPPAAAQSPGRKAEPPISVISVRLMDGSDFEIYMEENKTVLDLKRIIVSAGLVGNIAVDLISLTHSGQLLDDHRPLSPYAVTMTPIYCTIRNTAESILQNRREPSAQGSVAVAQQAQAGAAGGGASAVGANRSGQQQRGTPFPANSPAVQSLRGREMPGAQSTIVVRFLNGLECSLEINLDEQISSLKKRVLEQFSRKHQINLTADTLELMYGGRKLDDTRTLSSYKINRQETHYLIARIKDAATPAPSNTSGQQQQGAASAAAGGGAAAVRANEESQVSQNPYQRLLAFFSAPSNSGKIPTPGRDLRTLSGYVLCLMEVKKTGVRFYRIDYPADFTGNRDPSFPRDFYPTAMVFLEDRTLINLTNKKATWFLNEIKDGPHQ